MEKSPLSDVARKPAVLVSVLGNIPKKLLSALENGLEEEGIPWEMRTVDILDTVRAASRLAKASRINVGLCLAGPDTSPAPGAVLHHRDLPEATPLFRLSTADLTIDSLIRLGRNAARLVKGNPFILDRPEER